MPAAELDDPLGLVPLRALEHRCQKAHRSALHALGADSLGSALTPDRHHLENVQKNMFLSLPARNGPCSPDFVSSGKPNLAGAGIGVLFLPFILPANGELERPCPSDTRKVALGATVLKASNQR